MVGVDKIGFASFDDRKDGIGIGTVIDILRWPVPQFRFPIRELGTAHQITRIRECRHPAAVQKLRVPTDMIGVEVGAKDDIDILGAKPNGGEPLRIRRRGSFVP